MTTPAARERAVWREFREAQGDELKRGDGWENPVEGSWSIMLLIVLVVLIAMLDERVWTDLPIREHPVLGIEPPLWFFPVSLLVLPVNGWLAHVSTSLRTPRDRKRPVWLRILRFAAACLLPLGSFLVVLQWRDLLRRDPSWAAPASGQIVRLSLRERTALPARPFLEHLCRSKKLAGGLMIASLFPFVLGVLLLLHAEGDSARSIAFILSIGLHVASFFSATFIEGRALRRRAGRPWKWFVRASRCALLIPLPSVWTPGVLLLFLAAMDRTRRTVIGDLYALHKEARRHSAWRRVELGHAPLRTRIGGDGRASIRRAALSRIAILLLAPEAGLLTCLLVRRSGRETLLEPVIVPALWTAAVLLFSSILLQALPPFARRLRWERIETGWTPYLQHGVLLLPASLFLGGCAGGLLAAQGEIPQIFVKLAALIIFLLCCVFVLLGVSTKGHGLDLGLVSAACALYAALLVMNEGLMVDPALAARSVLLLRALPVLGLVAGLALMPALLRPYTWRHLFDRRLPCSFRAVLAILSLTAILPLGGLAVPFWIWARQKLWPRYTIHPPRSLMQAGAGSDLAARSPDQASR